MYRKVAFTGYARSGKDTAAEPLIRAGYVRHPFGDIIKRQMDPLIREHLGFSAFTQDDEQKSQIRGVLEQWGEANYDAILKEYFETLPPLAVNTRLMRLREAEVWHQQGGVIVEIARGGVGPASQFEADCLAELHKHRQIDYTIFNNFSLEQLHLSVLRYSGVQGRIEERRIQEAPSLG